MCVFTCTCVLICRFYKGKDFWPWITTPFKKRSALKERNPSPEVIKFFSCSTQLSIKFFLLINFKMPTTVGILTFMSRKNSILGLSEPKNAEFLIFVYL